MTARAILDELHAQHNALERAVTDAVAQWEEQTGLICKRLEISHIDATRMDDETIRWLPRCVARIQIGEP